MYDPLYKEVNVSAGCTEVITFHAEEKKKVTWKYKIKSRDAIICIKFIKDDNDQEIEIKSAEKQGPHVDFVCGTFECPSSGFVAIEIDNGFSYWHGKTIVYDFMIE
jgi:hypothetical protein